jgi:TetR/AcrR family transcriptional regulator
MVDSATANRRASRRGPSARRRRRDPEATRQALMAAGTRLFAERGYDGVPVSAIADRAAVNKAMISYHFGGKRKLYRAILTSTFADIVARAEALARSGRPGPELLRELVALIADIATRRNPHFPAMMLREVLAGGRNLEPATMAYPLRVASAVRYIVERGVREGTFRPVDPLLTHLTLVGSLLFFFATAPVRKRLFAAGRTGFSRPDTRRYVEHMQELLIHGLADRPDAHRASGRRRPPARAAARAGESRT